MHEITDPQSQAELQQEINQLKERIRILEAANTNHIKTEKKLHRSEEHLRLALMAAHVGAWEWIVPTNEVYWSAGVEQIFGLEPNSFSGTFEAYLALIHPNDLEDVQSAIKQSLETGCRYAVQHRLVYPDGSLRWLACRGNVFQNELGHPTRMAGTVMDITKRIVAEQRLAEAHDELEQHVAERTADLKQLTIELAQQKQMLETIMNNTPDRYYILDQNGRYLYANPSGLAAQKLTEEQVIGRTWRDLNFPKRVGEKFDLELATVFRTGQKLVRQEQFSTPDLDRHVEYILNPVHDETGKITAVISAVRDISERKQAEAILQQAQKMESLGILAGGVAHDFNNLLVAMLGQTTLALAKLEADAPAKKHINKAVKAAKRAVDLTRQMLAYSGRGHFEIKPFDLTALIREYQELFIAAIPKNVNLELVLPDDALFIEADNGQIQQVLMNLILNAAEAIGAKLGFIQLFLYEELFTQETTSVQPFTGNILPPGPYICIKVRDNGAGMSSETLSKIFDPFFSTKFAGRGLGLASVLGIIRGHRGGIYVESESNVGTEFQIFLPAYTGVKEAPHVEKPPTPHHSAPNIILVIDDEEAVREGVTDILELIDVAVLTAEDGLQGVEIMRSNREKIKLVLLDLSMPGLSGEETLALLWEVAPDIPVALSSGYSEEEVARRFDNKQFAGFIQKPYTVDTLIDKVTALLG